MRSILAYVSTAALSLAIAGCGGGLGAFPFLGLQQSQTRGRYLPVQQMLYRRVS
jgi:hypothetical protein